MTYSSAVFEAPEQSLNEAQANKYRRLARLLDLKPEHEVLEIGCGWGGFACLAAQEFGCRVTGVTISQEQYAYAVERVRQAGLADRVTIELCDYRDVARRFDRICSIEMFEAVGEQYWPVFFAKLHDCLKPGGVAALQVITIADKYFEDYRRTMDFIQRYIFPGGMLPSPGALKRETAAAGLSWREEASFAPDYARTLAKWREDFRAHWPDIRAQGFDERFRRMWEFYLAYCEGGFTAKTIDVVQIALQRA